MLISVVALAVFCCDRILGIYDRATKGTEHETVYEFFRVAISL